MGDDEVLAAGLADDPRIVAVAAHVLGDRLPHAVEDAGRAREVDPGEVRARERRVADLGAGAVEEVDHAVGKPGFLEEPHQVVRAQHRGRRRLPEDDVPHQRRGARQVAGDRREVERRDREDEALERAVLEPVPDARRRQGLLGVDPRHELDVEAQEVDQLARRVDLGLMRGLRLAEHRRRVERVAPGAGEQLGRAQEDRGALLPRPARPVLPRLRGRVDRLLDVLGAALVHVGEHVRLVVRHHRRLGRAGRDVLAADHERDLDPLAAHLLEPPLQARALGAARRELAHRLVACGRGRNSACELIGRLMASERVKGAWANQEVPHRDEQKEARWGATLMFGGYGRPSGCRARSRARDVGGRHEHPDHEAE